MFGLTSGNKKPKFTGPKAMNRRQLLIQNLIFVFVAVIIIIILGFLVISNLTFLVDQINLSLRVKSGSSEVNSFNLTGLEAIKGKLPALTPEISPTPISTSTNSFATSTEELSTTTQPIITPDNLLME